MGCPAGYTLYSQRSQDHTLEYSQRYMFANQSKNTFVHITACHIKPTHGDSKMCPCAEVTAYLLTCLTDKILMQQDHLQALCLLLH